MNTTTERQAVYEECLALSRTGRLQAARGLCERAVDQFPTDFSLLLLAGIMNLQMGEPERAIAFLSEAVRIRADNAAVYTHQGNALFDLQRYGAAIDSYGRAIALRPDDAIALTNRGLSYLYMRQYPSAIDDFERLIEIDPRNAAAYTYRGHALRELSNYPAAILSYDAAIALHGDYAEAHNGRGSAIAAQFDPVAALAAFDQAIAIQDAFAEAHLNRGNVLVELGRFNEALASYDLAAVLKPDFAEAHYRTGDLQRKLGFLDDALVSYERALKLNPDMKLLPGARCLTRMQLCDWQGIDAQIAEIAAGIERGGAVCTPLAVLAFSSSADLQRHAAQVYVASECPPDSSLPPLPARCRKDKIKIGYFSPDFREHPVAYLTAELFESHDRGAFDVTAFSIGPHVDDAMSKRIKRAFERFIEVGNLPDRGVAELARELEIDVAVDLCGFTDRCRPRIFAMRAAPVQVSYVGYLGTMGAPYIDYLIADPILIPAAQGDNYSEKIISLPSYQANDSQRSIIASTRADLGLPQTAFVYCCFNNSYKITPATFSSWMRILKRTPGSVLFLYAPHTSVVTNLRREALSRGVDPMRLFFGTMLPRAEYLGRFQAADLFLDTSPYNGGATASDALWAGLPVLTCEGTTFAGRMGASLLTSLGMPELIASTPERYESLAVELAVDPIRLDGIRKRVVAQRSISPLFDIRRFATNLEWAYRAIHDRHLTGRSPDNVSVTP